MRTGSAFRFAAAALAAVFPCAAESGYDAWLRYPPMAGSAAAQYTGLPAAVSVLDDTAVARSARDELIRGVRGMVGRTLRTASDVPREPSILLGTSAALAARSLPAPDLPPDGYRISHLTTGGVRHLLISASNERGLLYGAFALLRKIALRQRIDAIQETRAPYAPVRWVNEWNNLNGTIERGYGGRSIFFDQDAVRADLSRVRDYARMLASLGINGCVINNVNANPRVLTAEFLPQAARIAAAFRPWGVQVALSVDFSSPRQLGTLDTFDPLDPRVAQWWQAKADEVYRVIPDLAGFVLKADSEGRLGPSAYGRTHADAANVIGRALAPHRGLLFYRGFVYNHRMDWRNLKNDRARAAVDNFQHLDGKFDDNVLIQIKHGPIDFQVREPASPLFGALEKTNQAIELQVTQEYFGQARHMVFLAPMWKDALDFDLRARGPGTPVKALAAGKTFRRPTGGFVGVSNAGMDENWTGNHLSQANLFAYGRLAWDPDLTAQAIAEEWIGMTFGTDPRVVKTVSAMLLGSWRVFEDYTGPLGLQTLTDITGTHYGPAVEASERNGWGQWHRADAAGVGMDRTTATGTGFIGQYRPGVAKGFESLSTCPEELLVFLHHVPYTHRLRSGQTVIQFLYDSHYRGAEAAAGYVKQWQSLRDLIDERRYGEVLAQLDYQAGHAQVWRDAIVSWFLKTSGIPDAKGRAGRYPGRVEAESMKLEGYVVTPVTPWETASGGLAVECPVDRCAASFRFDGPAGWHTLRIQYFDRTDGISRFRLLVSGQLIDEWEANDRLPARKNDGASSTRRQVRGVALRPGDDIRIEGVSGGAERAAIDYLEWDPARH